MPAFATALMHSRKRLLLVVALAAAFAGGAISRPALAQLRSRLSAAFALTNTDPAPYDMAHYQRKTSQFAQLRHAPKIVFLGDSRFEYAEWPNLFDRCDIANLGIAGDTTSGVVQRLLSSAPADGGLCVIQVGINDLSKGGSVASIAANYRRIIEALLKERHARVLVTSVILAGARHESLNEAIGKCNAALSKLSVEMGAEWLEVNGSLAPQGFLLEECTIDGVHLNAQGYERLRDALAPSLPK